MHVHVGLLDTRSILDPNCKIVLFVFVQGTIDKDYPKRKGGYSFEIGAAAAAHILQNIQPTVDLEFQTVCQKDSQDITDDDRLV